MSEMSRRDFLSFRGLSQILQKAAPTFGATGKSVLTAMQAISAAETTETPNTGRSVMAGYFSSPVYSSALLSEMPWDMLIEEAKHRGVAYEGRSKMEVVREIFLGTGGHEE